MAMSTERVGINAVERIILRIGWIFREQPVADVGIDALVEICEHGKPSGRLIALQIKSGESYFKEPSPEGFVYRGSNAHLEYWIGHSLPVFLVLYHPGRDQAWWCAITSERIERTPKGWRVTVPIGQRLEESSRTALATYAIPDFTRRQEIEDLASQFPSADSGATRISSLLAALAGARREIDIVSPSLDEKLLWALSAVAHHRIQVRLVTGLHSQGALQDEAHSHLSRRVHSDLHAKIVIIDRMLAVFGSANFTAHAWRLPAEQVLASADNEMVTATRTAFDEIWRASIDVDRGSRSRC